MIGPSAQIGKRFGVLPYIVDSDVTLTAAGVVALAALSSGVALAAFGVLPSVVSYSLIGIGLSAIVTGIVLGARRYLQSKRENPLIQEFEQKDDQGLYQHYLDGRIREAFIERLKRSDKKELTCSRSAVIYLRADHSTNFFRPDGWVVDYVSALFRPVDCSKTKIIFVVCDDVDKEFVKSCISGLGDQLEKYKDSNGKLIWDTFKESGGKVEAVHERDWCCFRHERSLDKVIDLLAK